MDTHKRPEQTDARRNSSRVLTLCLSFFITTLLAEGLFRLYEQRATIPPLYQPSLEEIKTSLPSLIIQKNISADTFNIYYFGESTMMGEPYQDTIPRLVGMKLKEEFAGKPLRWINLGNSGVDIAYSVDLMNWILSNKNQFHPSAFIVYSGHNEFLKYQSTIGISIYAPVDRVINWLPEHSRLLRHLFRAFRIYKLEIDNRRLFDIPLFSPASYSEVLLQYESSIASIIPAATSHGIPVIFSTLVSNYADFEPNRSVCDTDARTRERVQNYIQQGEQAEVTSNHTQALLYYSKTISVCPYFAISYYRMGRIYTELKQYTLADIAFQAAIDFDRMPIRATSKQNEFIRSLENNSATGVADALRYTTRSLNGVPVGYNKIIDGHHPDISGYIDIADAVVDRLLLFYPALPQHTEVLSPEVVEKLLLPTPLSRYEMLYSRSRWLIRMATWTFNPADRMNRAKEYVLQAIQIDPSNPQGYLLCAAIEMLRKNTTAAKEYISTVNSLDPHAYYRFFKEPWYAQIFVRYIFASLKK